MFQQHEIKGLAMPIHSAIKLLGKLLRSRLAANGYHQSPCIFT